jgi:hypothetical protein
MLKPAQLSQVSAEGIENESGIFMISRTPYIGDDGVSLMLRVVGTP